MDQQPQSVPRVFRLRFPCPAKAGVRSEKGQLQDGVVSGLGVFGGGILRLCTNVNFQYHGSRGLFENLAAEAEENGNLREALVNDIGDALALDDDDVKAIAEVRLKFEAELRDLDFGTMMPRRRRPCAGRSSTEVKGSELIDIVTLTQ